MIEHKLSGGPELLDLLDVVPRRFARSTVRGGVRAGARVIQLEARRLVRKRRRLLEKSIKISSRADGDVISAKVVTRGAGSFVAIWMEYGTRPHWVRVADEAVAEADGRLKPSRKAGGRARETIMRRLNDMVREGSLVINGKFVGPEVYHPGSRPFPFMRPALETKGPEAVNTVGEYMRERLTWGNLAAPQLETVEADEE